MVEIKFLKELPVRSLNKSSSIKLAGADIYVDKNANRFAFFGFRNFLRSPMFSLYLVIKQYDSFGSFIRETKFSLPSIYAPSGTYITEKPVRISDECEGCEVYIAYAEFATKQFYLDRLIKKSHLSDFTADYFAGAPKSVSCSIGSNIVIQKQEPVNPQPKVEEKKVEPYKAEEEADAIPVVEEKEPVKETTQEAVVMEEPVASEEKKVEEAPVIPESVVGDVPQVKHFRARLSRVNLILLSVSIIAFITLAVVLFVIF